MANEQLTVKHYLKTLEETVRQQWEQKALCDYGGEAFTYADVATSVEQFRLFLSGAGITKRSKMAICARNCARWAMTFWDTTANKSLPVYSKINEVEFVGEPFEKTPKMSIKRYLYR